MGTLPTILAGEIILTAKADIQAFRACLRRVARIDEHDADARTSSFVLDKLLKLVERPQVEWSALSLAEPAAVTDALQALEDNSQPVFFGEDDKLLADFVVDPFLVASLPTGKPFECPATRLARGLTAGICLRLQRRTNVSAMLAIVGKVLPLKLVSCGIGGDLAKPQIDAEGGIKVRIIGRLGRFVFNLNIEVVTILVASLERGTSGVLTNQPFALKVPQGQREDAATIQQAQADRLARHVQLEDASVVVDAGRLELTVPRLRISQPGRNPSNSTDGEVSRQTELLAHVAVAALVQIVLAMALVLISPISHEVAGCGKRFKCRVNASSYRRRNHQLAREGPNRFHAPKHSEFIFITQRCRFQQTQGQIMPCALPAHRLLNRYPAVA